MASASEESETDSSVSTPLRQPLPLGGTTAAAALSQLEFLQSKLQDLEEENLALRSEVRDRHRKDEVAVVTGTEKKQEVKWETSFREV